MRPHGSLILQLVVLWLCGAFTSTASSQATVGAITYNSVISPGKFVPIFGPDPSQPSVELHGNDPALYVGREPVKGTGYWAELWYGKTADMDSFGPVPGTLVHFKATVNAIDASKKVDLPGISLPGSAFLQLRVWESTVQTWKDVLQNPAVARGFSVPFKMDLENCSDCTRPSSTGYYLEGFGLFYPIPEPANPVLWLVAGSLFLSRGAARRGR